jgi:hypothetical protein
MQFDVISISQLAVPVGCFALSGWQFIRANKYRQRLTDAKAQHRDELAQREQYLADVLLHETGTQSVHDFITRWRQLNYRLGYALHHIEDFAAPLLLKEQLATIASMLRVRSKQPATYQPVEFWAAGAPAAGFREVLASEEEKNVERDIRQLVDGLDNWQLAGICCYIMDGYHLEGAFYKVGISVYSPTGKGMALGEKDLNLYGYRLTPSHTEAISQLGHY